MSQIQDPICVFRCGKPELFLSCDPRLAPLRRNRSASVREHAGSMAASKDFFKQWQPALRAAQLLQQRGTWRCQTPTRLLRAGEGESTAKAWLAAAFTRTHGLSERFQGLRTSSWRQQASIGSQTRGVQVKTTGRHKTQGVWQQLNPLIRNRLFLLLLAKGNSKAQKAIPERERCRGIFFPPITFKSCLETFIEDSILHKCLIPSLIVLFSGFLAAQTSHPSSECHEPFHSFLLNSECKWKHSASSSLTLLCTFPVSGVAALKGFLMPLLTAWSPAAYSSESFSCRFQTSPFISTHPKPLQTLLVAFVWLV